MMILLAVIVGYVLGIAPFLLPKINITKKNNNDEQIKKEQTQILDEYLNGAKIKVEEDKEEYIENKNSTKEIFEEYLTGISKGGE